MSQIDKSSKHLTVVWKAQCNWFEAWYARLHLHSYVKQAPTCIRYTLYIIQCTLYTCIQYTFMHTCRYTIILSSMFLQICMQHV